MIQTTILICTRDRPAKIVNAVRSLLSETEPGVELIVVDQSADRATEHALSVFRADKRLIYKRSNTRGKCGGLNEGLSLARGDIVVLTDDDCVAPAGWAQAMASTFAIRPRVAVVFCNVSPVEHDRRDGYVPSYERRSDRTITSLWGIRNGLGLGAGMAVRKDVLLAVGGFDEFFGPGARFPSADDWDVAIRVLARGWHIYETTSVTIVHDGFRTNSEGRTHASRDWTALGAVSVKPIRAGHLSAAVVPFCFYPAKALLPPCLDLLRLRRPKGLARITSYLRGFVAGLGTPMDSALLKFRHTRISSDDSA